MAEFDTSGAGVHANWPDRFFARLVDGFLAATGNCGGLVAPAANARAAITRFEFLRIKDVLFIWLCLFRRSTTARTVLPGEALRALRPILEAHHSGEVEFGKVRIRALERRPQGQCPLVQLANARRFRTKLHQIGKSHQYASFA